MINDPLTYDSVANTRQPFPGNQIPANRINPVSKNFFPYIPVTNLCVATTCLAPRCRSSTIQLPWRLAHQ